MVCTIQRSWKSSPNLLSRLVRFEKIVHFELVKSYRLLPYFSWPHIPKSDPANTLRIMLVADPQLPGYWNQPSSIFGSISRHDSDSYLARTYSQALHYIKPDIIIFLGKYRGPKNRFTWS